jgi:FkbM family methyltransferase
MKFIQILREIAFKVFSWAVKPLVGTDIARFRPLGALYKYLFHILVPRQECLVHIHGHKMLVLTNYDHAQLFLRGSYESCETVLFRQLVGKNMVVVDIGANIGYYTLLAAKLVGDKGKVYAFEPEPQNYDMLLRNIELNGYKNIVPVNKAAFTRSGKLTFVLSKDCAEHSLYRSGGDAGTITVDAISMDEFFKGKEHPVDIIKMDVEGAEMAVLLGMTDIIARNENLKLFSEFFPPLLQRSGFSPREYWDKLKNCGFKFIYLMNEQTQKLEQVEFDSVMLLCKGTLFSAPTVVNLLCTKSPLREGVSNGLP